MLSNQIIQNAIDDLNEITKNDLYVYDIESGLVASTNDKNPVDMEVLNVFSGSEAETQAVDNSHFFKIYDDGELAYVLVSAGSTDYAHTVGKIAVSQLSQLLVAYKERYDRSSFFRNLLLDNMLMVDVHNKALKFHIETAKKRMVFIIETDGDSENIVPELLKSMFVEQGGNYITSIDERNVILVKDMDEDSDDKVYVGIANTIVDMLASEAMMRVRVAYGLPVTELKNLSKCYKEAKMALEVGDIFYTGLNVLSYDSLGIGRLIYQLPVNLCKIFIKEVFGDQKPEDIDEETLATINKFFENNLNVSETARQLYIHRNTLVYRMEKLQKVIGLDMRQFDDAVTFKIVMMVVDYINYLESKEEKGL